MFRVRQEEGFFNGAEGLRLFFQTWQGQAEPRADLVITHGHGEHSECYHSMVEDLADLPIKFWAWDLRGHGRSQGPRGACRDFYLYTQDFEIFLRKQILPLKRPLILFAHSMGCLIQLKSLLGEPDFQNLPQILSAPFLGISMEIPTWKKSISRWFYELLPEFTLDNGIPYEDLSSDPKVLKAYRKDPYRHQKMSAGAFEPSLRYAEQVINSAKVYRGPILCLISDSDPVVSTPKAIEFMEKVGSTEKKLALFPGRKHEVLNDIGRKEPLEAIREFLLSRS